MEVSDNFTGTVWNTGVMRHGKYYSIDTQPNFDGQPITLGQILQDESEVPEKYFLTSPEKLEKFHYLRGPKSAPRLMATPTPTPKAECLPMITLTYQDEPC